MTLQSVQRFRVRSRHIRKTEEAIRSAGHDGYELFVVWSGTYSGNTFSVADVHIPRQASYKLGDGLCVEVDGSELHRLNVWLFEAQQVVGVQIHSHPQDAYHSMTDDAYPIATLDGSLSIVLPFFGRDGFNSCDIAAYRLWEGAWLELSYSLDELLEIVSDGTS